MAGRQKKMDFASLVYAIRHVDELCTDQAGSKNFLPMSRFQILENWESMTPNSIVET